MDAEKKRVAIKIFGRVQGVFFRAKAKREAERLNLAGFARNEQDGTVYVEAEGKEKALEEFLAWCKKGPAGAHVTHVEVNESPCEGRKGFETQR